jgi:phosphoglycerate dehydrogenase-like enzyme
MPTIVVLFPLKESILEQVRQAAPGWRVVAGPDPAVYRPFLAEAEVLVNWNKDAEALCLAEGAALRWVHTWGAGVNTLPLEKFRQRGVILTNTSGIHAYPISESIFALILSFSHRLHRFLRSQVRREWHNENDTDEIHGKTMGILGTGAIGSETARLARAFGMRVFGLRRTTDPAPDFDRTYVVEGLSEMLPECDFIVNTLPLTPQTRHLLSDEQFRLMKPTAFYVNIGRGATTDTDALVRALEEKRIAGAGLDVFEVEPLPSDHPLWGFENVLLMPHNSGAHPGYDQRAVEILVAGLREFVAGREPSRNRVDLTQGY